MRQGGSILTPFILVILFIVAVFYGVGALNTGNLFWILPGQPDFEPHRIVVRDAGEEHVYLPNSAEFDVIAAALNEAFSDFTNADLIPLGLSDITMEEYAETALTMEVYYPEPIRFNTMVRMSNVNQLLIPLRGRHEGNRYIFMGSNGRWRIGAMVMADDSALQNAMSQLGFLQ